MIQIEKYLNTKFARIILQILKKPEVIRITTNREEYAEDISLVLLTQKKTRIEH